MGDCGASIIDFHVLKEFLLLRTGLRTLLGYPVNQGRGIGLEGLNEIRAIPRPN